MPASRAAGKPTANRLSCGAERASMPITIWTRMIAKATGRAIERPAEKSTPPNRTRPWSAVGAQPGMAGRQRAIAFDDRSRRARDGRSSRGRGRWRGSTGTGRAPDSAGRWPDRPCAAKPRPIALPITSPATMRRGEADLYGEAEREAGHHLAADQHEAGDGGEAVGRQDEVGGAERRNADRQRDDEAQLDRHEARRRRSGRRGRRRRGGSSPPSTARAGPRPRRTPRGSSHELGDHVRRCRW